MLFLAGYRSEPRKAARANVAPYLSISLSLAPSLIRSLQNSPL